MIDREARGKLELALKRYAAGWITNDELDEAALDAARGSADPVASPVAKAAWTLFDDTRNYCAIGEDALSRTARCSMARWILFLRSDLEYGGRGADGPGYSLAILLNILTVGFFRRSLFSRWEEAAAASDLNVWHFRSRTQMRREMQRVEDETRAATTAVSQT